MNEGLLVITRGGGVVNTEQTALSIPAGSNANSPGRAFFKSTSANASEKGQVSARHTVIRSTFE